MVDTQTDSYYRQVCENLGVALIATDPDLNILSWNSAAALMFGAGAGHMTSAPMTSVFPQEERVAAAQLLHRSLDEGDISSFEFRHRDEHGKARDLIATIAPIVNDAGERIGVSTCVRDITRRMTLQRELHETRKMTAMGELAGSIAHHFNNILGGIITSVDYAGESGDPRTMQRVLAQTGRALLRTSRLVNGLLAFSGGTQHADDLADFSELLLTLLDDIEPDATKKGIELQTSVPKLPVFPVPRHPVMTILRNITRNAIEAMPGGGVLRIEVQTNDKSIRTDISDTGCGLDENTRARIFEPFWSTKTDPQSDPGAAVGLGLAIAHGLAHVIGGSIEVESAPGLGSCFTVTVPHPEHD